MKYMEALEKVQKRATKALPGLEDFSYEDRLKILKLPTLFVRSFDSYFCFFFSQNAPLRTPCFPNWKVVDQILLIKVP